MTVLIRMPIVIIITSELGYKSQFDILQIPGISFKRRHEKDWNETFVNKHKGTIDTLVKELNDSNIERDRLNTIKSQLDNPETFHKWFCMQVYTYTVARADFLTKIKNRYFNSRSLSNRNDERFGDKTDLVYHKMIIDFYLKNSDDALAEYDLLNIASVLRDEFINTKPYIKDNRKDEFDDSSAKKLYEIITEYVFRWLGYNSKFEIIKESRKSFIAKNKYDLTNEVIGEKVYEAIIDNLAEGELYDAIVAVGFKHPFEILQIKRDYFIKAYEGNFDKRTGEFYDWTVNRLSHQLSDLGYDDGGFSVVKTLRSQFVRDHDNALENQAGFVHDLLTSAASQEYADYCNKRLHSDTARNTDPKKPSYVELFPEKWNEFCEPGALEANDGQLAYLVDLYGFAKKLDNKAPSSVQTLSKRRPDLADLLLNKESRDGEVKRLELVNEILTSAISKKLGRNIMKDLPKDVAVEEAMSRATHPLTLPRHHAWQKITMGLSERQTSFREVLQTFKPDTTSVSEEILLVDSGLHPTQIDLLIGRIVSRSTPNIFSVYYGISTTYNVFTPEVFLKQTGLTLKEAKQLFCTGEFSVKKSSYLTNPSTQLTPKDYGAVYVNYRAGVAIDIREEENNQLTWVGKSEQKLDKLQRFIRLLRWSKLFDSNDKLDRLIKVTGNNPIIANISLNSLKTLGLFKYLNNKYFVGIDHFLACIDNISEYAIGETSLPFLDQVLNIPTVMDDGFKIDDREFSYSLSEEEEQCGTIKSESAKIVNRLCASFKIDQATFRVLADEVQKAQDLPKNKLKLSLDVISALYRLINVPKLFRLPSEYGIILLENIVVDSTGNAPSGVRILASKPSKKIVDVIINLDKLLHKLSQLGFTSYTDFVHLQEYSKLFSNFDTLSSEYQEVITKLREELKQGLADTLLTDQSPTRVMLKKHIEELIKPKDPESTQDAEGILKALIDNHGLILHVEQEFRQTKEEALTKLLTRHLKTDDIENEHFKAIEMLLSNAIEEQNGVIFPIIGNKVEIQDQDLLSMLLRWRRSSPYEIANTTANKINDKELFKVLWNIKYYEIIMKNLKIDNNLLHILIECFVEDHGYQVHEFTHRELMALKSFREWFDSGSHDEERIWEYFKQFLTGSNVTQKEKLKKLSELTGLDHTELCQVISYMFDPSAAHSSSNQGSGGEFRTPIQFGQVLQFKALSDNKKISLASLISLAKLNRNSEFSEYNSAANSLLMDIQSQA